MAKNANLLTVFAEDVREERSGQVSLIGVFDDEVEVPSLPIVIPKLRLISTLSMLLCDPIEIASFRVFFKGGETLVSEEMPAEISEGQQAAIDQARKTDDREWVSLRIQVEINNLKIEQDSALCAEIVGSDGSVATSNSLQITLKKTSNRTPNITI